MVVDLDDKDCMQFKQEMLDILNGCYPQPTTRFRIAIEEGEAWLLGDRDAVKAAYTPILDRLGADWPAVKLKAHGTAVGLPDDGDMGNSEVGHNAMGCGRVFAQGAKLVFGSIASGAMFEGNVWKKLMENGRNGTLHLNPVRYI